MKRFRNKGLEHSFVLYILLFLACLNFMGRGPVIFLIFSVWGIIKARKGNIKWTVSTFCYLLMTITALITSLIFFDDKETVKSLVYFLAFAVGYKGYCASVNKNLFIRRVIFAVFAGFLGNLIITYYLNFIVLGHVAGRRELYSFWTNDLMSVTLAGLMSSVPIAYSFYCFFCNQKLIYKVLGLVSIAVIAVVNMGTATRTPFVLIGLVYVIMLYELFRSGTVKHKTRLILILSVCFFILFYKVFPIIADSAIAERFDDEGVNTSRVDITFKYMSEMFDFPFGGSEIAKHTHLLAHNFVLESYDMYGIFFFVPMIILLVLIVYRILLIHNIKYKSDVAFLLLAMYVSVFVQIMLEPVIGGYPQLVWVLFLIDGVTIPYLKDIRTIQNLNKPFYHANQERYI